MDGLVHTLLSLQMVASMSTMLTQNKPSEAFRRFGLATMITWMDGPTPFQHKQALSHAPPFQIASVESSMGSSPRAASSRRHVPKSSLVPGACSHLKRNRRANTGMQNFRCVEHSPCDSECQRAAFKACHECT